MKKLLRFSNRGGLANGVTLTICSVLLASLGCASDRPESEVTEPSGSDPASAGPLTLEGPVHHLDRLAREPMLALHPNGDLFLTGYPSQVTGQDPDSVPQLWRSSDRGKSWQWISVGTAQDGATGNSDVDLAISADGVLYVVAMGFDRSTGTGTHVSIGTSYDVGESWQWQRLSETPLDDRPWVEVAPDGVAHVVWNDGEGVCYAVSSDQGRSWQERDRIHPQGGSSHLAIGPQGEIAVRITPLSGSGNVFHPGVELVAVSIDGGESFSEHPVPGDRDWDPTFQDQSKVPRWVEPLAFTDDGSLWLLYSSGTAMKLARSSDRGATWQEQTLLDHHQVAYFPYLTSRGSELAGIWFSGTGETQVANLARIETAAQGDLQVRQAAPFAIDAWNEGDGQTTRTTGGEYLPVLFLSDGSLAVAAPIQDAANDRWGFSFWRAR